MRLFEDRKVKNGSALKILSYGGHIVLIGQLDSFKIVI
jgi:hypothetical protein